MRWEAAAARNVQQANKFVNKCCQSKELQLQLKPSHSNSLSGRSHSASHTHTKSEPVNYVFCVLVALFASVVATVAAGAAVDADTWRRAAYLFVENCC